MYSSSSISHFDGRVSEAWDHCKEYNLHGFACRVLGPVWKECTAQAQPAAGSDDAPPTMSPYQRESQVIVRGKRKALRVFLISARKSYRKSLIGGCRPFLKSGLSLAVYQTLWQVQRKYYFHYGCKDRSDILILPAWSPTFSRRSTLWCKYSSSFSFSKESDIISLSKNIEDMCPWHPSFVGWSSPDRYERQGIKISRALAESPSGPTSALLCDRDTVILCSLKLLDVQGLLFCENFENDSRPSWAIAASQDIPMNVVRTSAQRVYRLMETAAFSFAFVDADDIRIKIMESECFGSQEQTIRSIEETARITQLTTSPSITDSAIATSIKKARRRAFESWIYIYKLRRLEKVVLASQRYKLMQTAFGCLVRFYRFVHSSHELADRRNPTQLLRRVFNRFATVVTSRLLRQEETVAHFWRRSSLKRTLVNWKAFKEQTGAAKACNAEANKQWTTFLFLRWKRYYYRRQRKKHHLDSCRHGLARVHRTRLWHLWRVKVSRRKLLRRLFVTCLQARKEQRYSQWREYFALQRTALFSWREYTVQQHKVRQLQAAAYTAAAFYRVNRVSRCWRLWRIQQEIRLRKREATRRLLECLYTASTRRQEQIASLILRAWKTHVEQQNRLLKEFEQYWRYRRPLRGSMDALVVHWTQRKGLNRLIERRHGRMLSHAFERWKCDFLQRRFFSASDDALLFVVAIQFALLGVVSS
eukprot:gb/GECG01004249.1/.p1 GENE.gb/GECG01004249.1/~~gb/GECG01004249.1/.p1  ORF type:complete len:703 (+),score=57.38 gb/GECG01004249.1/:1-2109(+)